MKNGEGYTDNTAGEAIYEADKLPRSIANVVRALKTAASKSGLKIKSLELEDKNTGKKYWYER